MLHLIHPALVHFGVAFIATGALIEAFGWWTDREAARRYGAPLLAAGTVILVAVIATGYVAANTIELPPGALDSLKDHERQGWILLAAVVGLQFWKAWFGGRLPAGQRRIFAVALVLAVGLLLYGAWLGGRLVYTLGVGVGQ